MHRTQVTTEWHLAFDHEASHHTVPASVPGNALLDVLDAGLISDPYFASNVDELESWESTRWTYSANIDIPALGSDRLLLLRFDGIDTIATIRVGGRCVARSENMFVPISVDVTEFAGTRVRVEIEIESPIEREWERKRPAGARALSYNYASLYLRKARHSFGWDIAPRIVTSGIWRSVWIERRAAAEIDDVYVHTKAVGRHEAVIEIDWWCILPRPRSADGNGPQSGSPPLAGSRQPPGSPRYELRFRLLDAAGEAVASTSSRLRFPTGRTELTVTEPKLWWPAGYGDAYLYRLEMTLSAEGEEVDRRSVRCGIRTVELIRADATADSEKCFEIRINDTPTFVRGSNWVPSDAFHSRAAAKIGANLAPYVESSCNLLRIWGGGIYEDESLFDRCDETGIMVWQDFMFACEIPPHDQTYAEQVMQEIEVVAHTYRNHPSLILWCGDNENDAMMRVTDRVGPGVNDLTRVVIPRVLADHDPFRPYLPSSPYISESVWRELQLARAGVVSGAQASRAISNHTGSERVAASPLIPEQHLWGPRDAFKGDFYRLNTAVFAGEIGYHGCPSPASIRRFVDADALDRNSEIGRRQWLTHAAQPHGEVDGPYAYRIGLMEKQVAMLFGTTPDELDLFAAASQISQAEAKKFFVESFRMRKGEKTGIVWWNMQDLWPQFSDAVIDYYGERKLAWHYLSASQRPVCLFAGEPRGWRHRVCAANDTLEPVAGIWRVRTADGSYTSDESRFSVPANGRAEIGSIPYADSLQRLYLIEWHTDADDGQNHYISGAPPWPLGAYLADWLPLILDGRVPEWMAQAAGRSSV